MRWFTIAAALFGSHASLAFAANLRMTTAPTSKTAPKADRDLVKLETIEHSLQGLAKQAHAPNGTSDLLHLLSKSEGELKAAGKDKEKREAVMDHVNAAMKEFQLELVKRSQQLKKDSEADEMKKADSMKSIAKRLEDRLARLDKLEKDLRARAKDREDQEAKLKKSKANSKKEQSKEDLKTEKLLKYFAKKNKRELKKKLASWAVERQALTDAIRLAKSGDAEGTRKAMEKVIKAEKGDQDFLH